jgi:hypothetical protein
MEKSYNFDVNCIYSKTQVLKHYLIYPCGRSRRGYGPANDSGAYNAQVSDQLEEEIQILKPETSTEQNLGQTKFLQ